MFYLAKYNTQTTFVFPMVKRGVVDLAVTADWTPAATDASVVKDAGNAADSTNTVAIAGTSGTRGLGQWKLTLTATELSAAEIVVQIVDAATKAVEDQTIIIYTYGNASAKIPFDLSVAALTAASIATGVWQDATGADFTTASSIGKALYVSNVAPGGSGGHMISGSNAGTTTLGALTVTGATTHTGNVLLSDGLTIAAPSTVDRAGLAITGNGAGAGIISTGGATGDGVKAVGGASGHGLTAQGTGTTRHGVNAVGGTTTSAGIAATGGATSGDGMLISAGASGHGINTAGVGTTKHGITAAGGSTTSHGINATGGGVGHGILATSGGGATGDGIRGVSAATAGNGLNLLGNGTGNGLLATGGAGAGGDGIEAAAGGGVDIRANQTGSITGNLSGSVGSVTGAVGSVTGAVGSVTGNVGGNVTGSVGSVVGAVGSVTGNVGGNVTGSVGSVVGAVGSVSGNVGGNVVGTVASVVGAVGSVTGNVGGNVTGSIGSLAVQAKADVNAEADTALADYDAPTHTELTAELATADDATLAAIAALTIPTAAQNATAVLTTQMTESYAANGTAPTLAQAIYAIHQDAMVFTIAGTDYTVKKLDGTTTAFIKTLDDDTSPTAATRS